MSVAEPHDAGTLAAHSEVRSRVADQLVAVERALASHAGGIQLIDVSKEGIVRLRFSGMCAGCLLRPLTMSRIVEPALADIPGVARLEASGTRISTAARARLQSSGPRQSDA